jgi:hypothetical protein
MPKSGGLGAQLYVSGYDFTNDFGSVDRIGGGPALHVVTGIDKSAFERIGGRLDGSIESTVFFNKDTDRAHKRFSPLPYTDQQLYYGVGTTLGNDAAAIVTKQLNYDGTRAQDGMLTFKVAQQASGGYPLEWGKQLTAGKRTDTGATVGAAVDLGSASPGAFGLSAYLQVFSFTGTDVTIKIQESSDNAGDAYVDVVGGGFTQVTAGPTHQRIQTGAIAVERFLKLVTTTSAGFTSLVFAVMAQRHECAVSY